MYSFVEWLEKKTGIKGFYSAVVLGIILFFVVLFWYPGIVVLGIQFLIAISPIWLPFFILRIGWHLWLNYIRSKYISEQEYVLLEIRLPREISKSPLAMEAVLSGLHISPGETTWIKTHLQGGVRPWFSIEIASIEGKIHFYVWTRKFIAPRVKSQFYAQYPEIEIVEVEDYTRFQKYDPKELSVWGCDYMLTKPDPYPIKTYVDYGLDKDPKEEFKVDPMAHLLEELGSVGKGEQFWLQIMIRVNKNEKHVEGSIFGKKGWRDEAQEILAEIKRNASPKYVNEQGVEQAGFPLYTEGDHEVMKAIDRSLGKLAFDVGMRTIYLAKPENFSPIHIYGVLNAMKQFNSPNLNSFSVANWDANFDYPWQEWFGYHAKIKKKLFDAYVRRSYFHYPYKTQPFILNTEELATLFHIPSSIVQTPTIERIPSRRGEAPSNLPI